jgi:hypothetical protein
MLDDPPAPPPPGRSGSPAAARSRRWRAQRRAGIRTLQIRVPERRLVTALRRAGRLADDSVNRVEIMIAVEAVLADYITRWLPEKKPSALRSATPHCSSWGHASSPSSPASLAK